MSFELPDPVRDEDGGTVVATRPPATLDELPRDLRALVLRLAGAVGSDTTKNKTYLATQLGRSVARPYLSWKENEDGAAESTLDTYERILSVLCIWAEERNLTLEGLNDADYLWYCHPGGHPKRRHDRPIVDASMHQWWVRCIEAAGIPYRNLHVTRHTYATEWRRRGLAMDDVGTLLRHADFRTTQRVYVHTKLIDVRKRMEACER